MRKLKRNLSFERRREFHDRLPNVIVVQRVRMQSAVLAIVSPSVCPSVHPSMCHNVQGPALPQYKRSRV